MFLHILLHKDIKTIVKMPPHVRIKMNPSNTLGVRRRCDIILTSQKTAPTIHNNIPEHINHDLVLENGDLLQLEELPHKISHPTKSP